MSTIKTLASWSLLPRRSTHSSSTGTGGRCVWASTASWCSRCLFSTWCQPPSIWRRPHRCTLTQCRRTRDRCSCRRRTGSLPPPPQGCCPRGAFLPTQETHCTRALCCSNSAPPEFQSALRRLTTCRVCWRSKNFGKQMYSHRQRRRCPAALPHIQPASSSPSRQVANCSASCIRSA